MKRAPLFLLVILALSLASLAFAPVAGIELPEELVGLLSFLVMLLFTALARWVSSVLGFDIKDRAAEIASAVAAIVVVALNHYLKGVPIEYDSWLKAVFAFLTVLFGGNGVYSLLLREKARPLKGEITAK